MEPRYFYTEAILVPRRSEIMSKTIPLLNDIRLEDLRPQEDSTPTEPKQLPVSPGFPSPPWPLWYTWTSSTEPCSPSFWNIYYNGPWLRALCWTSSWIDKGFIQHSLVNWSGRLWNTDPRKYSSPTSYSRGMYHNSIFALPSFSSLHSNWRPPIHQKKLQSCRSLSFWGSVTISGSSKMKGWHEKDITTRVQVVVQVMDKKCPNPREERRAGRH